jgi:hypothetical protein
MLYAKNLFAVALFLSFFGCRPPRGANIYESETVPILTGLAAAIELEEIKVGSDIGYKVQCQNGDTETHSKSEIEANKLCLLKAPVAKSSTVTTVDTPTVQTGTLAFGEKSFLKANAVDCTAVGCPAQEDACRVALNGTENVLVKSVQQSDSRAYDHIMAERAATAQCAITKVYIFFEHLTVSAKFTQQTTLPGGCVIAKDAAVEGRILKLSTPFEITFRVKKSIACQTGGSLNAESDVAFSSDNIEITPVIRAILGL